MNPILTPEYALKIAELTPTQLAFVQKWLDINNGVNIRPTVKTGIDHVINKEILSAGKSYLINPDAAVEEGDTLSDGTSTYTIIFVENFGISANETATLEIVGNDAYIGKYIADESSDNVKIWSTIKAGINHLIDKQLLGINNSYLIKPDKIIQNGDTISDNTNTYNVIFRNCEYIPPNWLASIEVDIDNLNAYVSRYDYFKDFAGSLDLKFGSNGVADGQFDNPNNIFFKNGKLYITDGDNQRVQIFDINGNFISKFGSGGISDGQFDNPNGIAVNDTNIFIVDTGNYRVQIFDLAGVFVSKFGLNGAGDGDFNLPEDIVVNDTNIFVTDKNNHRVQIFDLAGVFVSKFGSSGTGDGQFDNPVGIAVNDTNIFIVDRNNNRVQIFDLAGVFVSKFGTSGTGDRQFDTPTGIIINNTNIFVTDTFNNRVQIFDLAGVFVSKFGSSGTGDGQFDNPNGIEVNNTNIFVVDRSNNRIQKFI